MSARLSIVIVSYQARAPLLACLASLRTHPGRPGTLHEILVVDNASTDGTVEALRTDFPSVRLIEAGSNVGFGKANNIGVAQASGELVLLLNPDTLVSAATLDTLVAALDSRDEVVIAGPRLVDGHGRAELSFGSMISPLAELRQKLLVRGNDRGIGLASSRVERMTRQARDVDWVSGACLLIRRADYERLGGFDERFFMYFEDVDLCARARATGRQVIFVPSAEVVHLRGRSAATAQSATALAYRRSQLAFYQKHHPAWTPWLELFLKVTGRLPDTSI
jgi:GT2 family glycosyltransferase